MTTRRKFIKATAVSASYAAAGSVLAQMTNSVPAVNSLLLEDDSPTLECSGISVSQFSYSISYTGAGGAVIVQLETPNGSRIVADGAFANVDGNCNQWQASGTDGTFNSRVISLTGMSVNEGRYPLFISSSASADIFANIRGRVAMVDNEVSSNISIMTGEERLVGSINISDGEEPRVRILNTTRPITP